VVVGTLCLCLRLEGCRSLKDKRQILRSLLDRIRRDFGVAIAEVGDYDLWGNAVVGVSCVSNDPAHVESILQHVIDAFDGSPLIEVVEAVKEVERKT
jgi:uncharacterized protein